MKGMEMKVEQESDIGAKCRKREEVSEIRFLC